VLSLLALAVPVDGWVAPQGARATASGRWPRCAISSSMAIPDALPFFGRVRAPGSEFLPLTEDALSNHLKKADASTPPDVSVVYHEVPWSSEAQPSVGPILEAAARRWTAAPGSCTYFISVPVTRGTPLGERVYEVHRSLGFPKAPIVDVYCGVELVNTLELPRGRGRGADAACPLFTESFRVDVLQRAVAAARQRLHANRRWMERRRVLLGLRRKRQDLRRMENYRASGQLARRWRLFQQADSMVRGRPAFPAQARHAARRQHLRGLFAHASRCRALQREVLRLERQRHLLAAFVLSAQRCSPEGCVALPEP